MNAKVLIPVAVAAALYLWWKQSQAQALLIQNYPMSAGVVRRPDDVYL